MVLEKLIMKIKNKPLKFILMVSLCMITWTLLDYLVLVIMREQYTVNIQRFIIMLVVAVVSMAYVIFFKKD